MTIIDVSLRGLREPRAAGVVLRTSMRPLSDADPYLGLGVDQLSRSMPSPCSVRWHPRRDRRRAWIGGRLCASDLVAGARITTVHTAGPAATVCTPRPVTDVGHLSISHHGGYAAAAWSNRPCGIDLADEADFADRRRRDLLFTATERSLLATDAPRGYALVWSVVEAVGKATGRGAGGANRPRLVAAAGARLTFRTAAEVAETPRLNVIAHSLRPDGAGLVLTAAVLT